MKGSRLLALCFDYVLVRCRCRYTEEVVKCNILALRCLHFISKPENFMVCSSSARVAWCVGQAITFFGPRGYEYREGAEQHHSQQQQPHLACVLSAALTSDVRREFFVAVDAAQNVAQSRVRGPTNSPRVNCTLRPSPRSSLRLKITYHGRHTPHLKFGRSTFSRPTASLEDDHDALISPQGRHPRSVVGRWQSRIAKRARVRGAAILDPTGTRSRSHTIRQKIFPP